MEVFQHLSPICPPYSRCKLMGTLGEFILNMIVMLEAMYVLAALTPVIIMC